MSEKNTPAHDSGSEALTETPEAPAVPEVAGTPVRPELRLEVITAPTGQFGASDAGDTTGSVSYTHLTLPTNREV